MSADVDAPHEAFGWWLIRGNELLQALRDVQAGDDADLKYAELYANGHQASPDELEELADEIDQEDG